ncbi:MAG: site-specific DNA-methyltransferase [Flavobacteriales bacterium]|nr:site-specific DNA-methyltransferase [Flavobacteriales bacterium]
MAPLPLDPDEQALFDLVPADGSTIGNGKARKTLGWPEDRYDAARRSLLSKNLVATGRGRGGSLYRIVETDLELVSPAPGPKPVKPAATPKKKAGKSKKSADGADILSYRHDQRRANNPDVGMVTPESDPDEPKTSYAYDPHLDPALQFDGSATRARVERLIDDALASQDEATMRAALEELRRLQAPYLQWTGKAERTSFEVDTVSLHVHERIDPASILAAVRKRMDDAKKGRTMQGDLFAAPFEQLPLREAIDFYKHDKGWSNRLVLGDSLLVMNSLLQKESMAGKVQMVYIDPPYGIKYGSNFQPFVDKRDVKDRNDEDLTQEPEMIRAFRDTWELGIHSYLTYLRDRLLLAKELLHESGSVFVQISDENLHHVRELMDEVFGAENMVSVITFKKTTGAGSPAGGTDVLASTNDFIVWYAKVRRNIKYKELFLSREGEGWVNYNYLRDKEIRYRRLTPSEASDWKSIPSGSTVYRRDNLTSTSSSGVYSSSRAYQGLMFSPHPGGWKTSPDGLVRLASSGRFESYGSTLAYRRFATDYPWFRLTNLWDDTVTGGYAEARYYVVQTGLKVIERCMLMCTDPSDLVLDITCGSGTSAVVAEKQGRRWITCDSSRVAVTLAKQRLMTASFDYYALKYPHEGLKGGFIYKMVPHVTLKSIANNPEIDAIYERMHPAIADALAALNSTLRAAPPKPFKVAEGGRKGKAIDFKKTGTEKLPSGEEAPAGALLEWEVPFDLPEEWPATAQAPFEAFHAARITMQREMDRSIAAHADQETLYDQPEVDKKKLRISGPFTVEAVPTPTVLSLDEAQQPTEADASIARSGESARQHQWRDELLKTGIRGKGGQVYRFAELETLPNGEGYRHLHCSGSLAETGERVVVCFGPAHASLEQRTVAHAINEAAMLVPKPRYVVFAAFVFDPEAAKDIDETKWPGVTLLKAQMNTDLLTDDLKKSRKTNESFWLVGQPHVELRTLPDGRHQVEVLGFDYFDMAKGELISGGTKKVAMWLLDTDYDERSLYPRQVFFPMAGKKDGWNKLKKTIRAELNGELLEQYHGTESLPFEAGPNRKVAVKLVDDRGIESLKIISLP